MTENFEERFHLANVIEHDGHNYYVSTVDLKLRGILGGFPFGNNDYETMVFTCDADGEVDGWGGLACVRTESREDAERQHKYVCEHIKDYTGGRKDA